MALARLIVNRRNASILMHRSQVSVKGLEVPSAFATLGSLDQDGTVDLRSIDGQTEGNGERQRPSLRRESLKQVLE
jgi:hypothetical protein